MRKQCCAIGVTVDDVPPLLSPMALRHPSDAESDSPSSSTDSAFLRNSGDTRRAGRAVVFNGKSSSCIAFAMQCTFMTFSLAIKLNLDCRKKAWEFIFPARSCRNAWETPVGMWGVVLRITRQTV